MSMRKWLPGFICQHTWQIEEQIGSLSTQGALSIAQPFLSDITIPEPLLCLKS
jgi:hypothetical protein